MKKMYLIFKESAIELTRARTITITGIFIAIYAILEGVFSINIGPYIRINLSFLSLAIIGMLFGPSVSIVAAALCDTIGFLIKPSGGFLVLFTAIAMLQGLIYGILLYKRDNKRFMLLVILARLLDSVVCNLLLNTMALSHYGFIPANITREAMLARLAKNVIEFPIYCVLLGGVLLVAKMAYNNINRRV